MGCAIVAIPDDRDHVWDISSEKIPHMTLLFLGEVKDGQDEISQFVQHVAETSLHPFGLSVKKRGLLGDENADVLFFNKDDYQLPNVERARSFLLTNPHIRKAYESAFQYPEWTPHLTLGYPKTPAKKDKEENRYSLSWVEFGKIAVWFDDFSGPTFDLEHKPEEAMEVSMSDSVDDFLEHYGVKGMKWGVRNDKGHEGQKATNKKIAKADKKFEKGSMQQYWAVHNAAADRMNGSNGELAKINERPKYKKAADSGDLLDMSKPITQQYHREIQETLAKAMNEESVRVLGTNASGTKKWAFEYDLEVGMPTGRLVDTDDKKVKHAEPSIVKVKFTWDKKTGLLQKIDFVNDEIEQSDDVSDFLEHFGVKGMRWGVRRSEPSSVQVSSRPGKKVSAKGGANQPAHEDAIRVAISKQKAKTSSTDSLSTKELQELVTRMNLEQQYSNLTSRDKKDAFKSLEDGRKKVDTVMNVADTYAKVNRFLNTPGGKIIKDTINTAVKNKLRNR